jgi:seryl-tRNA synthetase
MNEQLDSSNHIHIPLALLACTVAILLASQIGAAKQSARLMKWQSETLEKQVATMQATDKQMADAIKNREGVVKQSGELQSQLQTLLNEMLDLAKEDKDAQEIIKKWNVQRNTPPAGAATDASAASPEPDAAKKTP